MSSQPFALLEREITLARQVARRVARTFYSVEADDLEQQTILWLLTNQKYVLKYRLEWEAGGRQKLGTALGRDAQTYALKELRAQENRPANSDTDHTFYTETIIRRALPYIWENPFASPTLNESVDVSMRDRAHAILMDVSQAFHKLRPADRVLVAAHYRDGLTYEQIGSEFGLSGDAARKRVDRALGRMMITLAGSPPWLDGAGSWE